MFQDPMNITPEQFELHVLETLRTSANVANFRIEHREKLPGMDGTYEIDITIRFEEFGVDFLILVECKHYKKPVERKVVQELQDKVRSIGAQKGIIASTAFFQKGAMEYAEKHGIALIHVTDGRFSYQVRSQESVFDLPFIQHEEIHSWLVKPVDGGFQRSDLGSMPELLFNDLKETNF